MYMYITNEEISGLLNQHPAHYEYFIKNKKEVTKHVNAMLYGERPSDNMDVREQTIVLLTRLWVFEIYGVRLRHDNYEQCDDQKADTFGVYYRLPKDKGGIRCLKHIKDFPTRIAARQAVANGLINIPQD